MFKDLKSTINEIIKKRKKENLTIINALDQFVRELV